MSCANRKFACEMSFLCRAATGIGCSIVRYALSCAMGSDAEHGRRRSNLTGTFVEKPPVNATATFNHVWPNTCRPTSYALEATQHKHVAFDFAARGRSRFSSELTRLSQSTEPFDRILHRIDLPRPETSDKVDQYSADPTRPVGHSSLGASTAK
jgi:hypothetical protein